MNVFYRVGLIGLALLQSGCGTVVSIAENRLSPYSGSLQDLQWMTENRFVAVFATLDLPLSFVFDTLLLPVSLN